MLDPPLDRASARAPRGEGQGSRDAAVAVGSAFILGLSLLLTWSVALLVRLYLPRHLGPETFGVLHFSDTFAATSFVVLGLGVELYIQKNIPVRPAHASDFFGGVVLLRLVLSAAVFGAMLILLALMGQSAAVQRVVLVFGAGYLVASLNGSLSGLLYATRTVGGVATINVASKVMWGGGIALAIWAGVGLIGLATAFLLAELVRLVALAHLARKHVGLSFRVDPKAVKLVILASLPIYVNQIAITIYGKVDVTMLNMLAGDAEVGYYSTAGNLAGLALLVSPLVGWVLLPLLSRAASRSREEMFAILRRAIEAILLLVFPLSLLMGLGADIWVPLLFGEAFAPSVHSLRILSPVFVLSYMTIVAGACLLLLDRAWTLARVSLVGLVVNPCLNLLLVPWAMGLLGVGGAGAGAAIALLLTEGAVTVVLLHAVGREAFDGASVAAIGKAMLACGVIVIVDHLLRPLAFTRLLVDAALYPTLLLAFRAVKPSELRGMVRFLRQRSFRRDASQAP